MSQQLQVRRVARLLHKKSLLCCCVLFLTTVLMQDVIPKLVYVLLMAAHQAAAGRLKATLGSWSARLTEQDYVNLVKQGFDSPEALLDAQDKSLGDIFVCQGVVDAVLASQHIGKWQHIP